MIEYLAPGFLYSLSNYGLAATTRWRRSMESDLAMHAGLLR